MVRKIADFVYKFVDVTDVRLTYMLPSMAFPEHMHRVASFAVALVARANVAGCVPSVSQSVRRPDAPSTYGLHLALRRGTELARYVQWH